MRIWCCFEFDDLCSLTIEMCFFSIFFIKINIFEGKLEFSNIDSSKLLFFFNPLTILVQEIFVVIILLNLEFKSFLFIWQILYFLLLFYIFPLLLLVILFDLLADFSVILQFILKLFFLILQLVMIFEILSKKSDRKLRFFMKYFSKSLCYNVRYLRIVFKVLDLCFHFKLYL